MDISRASPIPKFMCSLVLAVWFTAASAATTDQECSHVAQIRDRDTRGHCCWPGQAWSESRQRCVGVPSRCPEPLLRVEGEETCVEPGHMFCPAGQVASPATRGHCCWPGQVWQHNRCAGIPTDCPAGRVLDERKCRSGSCDCVRAPCMHEGMVNHEDHCCWPGQVFNAEIGECKGTPNCPLGWGVDQEECVFVGYVLEQDCGISMAKIPDGVGSVGPGGREVRLSRPIWMSVVPVTQRQYEDVLGEAPWLHEYVQIHGTKLNRCSDVAEIGDQYPAFCLSWLDAVRFCNALSEKEHKTPVYRFEGDDVVADMAAGGYRLPTETEWEIGALAGQSSSWPYVGTDDPSEVCEAGNMADASLWDENIETFPCADGCPGLAEVDVPWFLPNAYLLGGMNANISEWTQDVFRDVPLAGIDPVSIWDDRGPGRERISCGEASGPGWLIRHVVRGANWLSEVDMADLQFRSDHCVNDRAGDIGFRIVRNAR